MRKTGTNVRDNNNSNDDNDEDDDDDNNDNTNENCKPNNNEAKVNHQSHNTLLRYRITTQTRTNGRAHVCLLLCERCG